LTEVGNGTGIVADNQSQISCSEANGAVAGSCTGGLLSLLPAMLRVPMQELAPSLPLREEICTALLGAPILERRLLEWVIAHEQGDWTGCDAIAAGQGLEQETLVKNYEQAVVWAEAAIRFA
jgi:c-di-GMP phosphodiesterase